MARSPVYSDARSPVRSFTQPQRVGVQDPLESHNLRSSIDEHLMNESETGETFHMKPLAAESRFVLLEGLRLVGRDLQESPSESVEGCR